LYVAVLYYVFTGKGEQVSIGWYVNIFILYQWFIILL